MEYDRLVSGTVSRVECMQWTKPPCDEKEKAEKLGNTGLWREGCELLQEEYTNIIDVYNIEQMWVEIIVISQKTTRTMRYHREYVSITTLLSNMINT